MIWDLAEDIKSFNPIHPKWHGLFFSFSVLMILLFTYIDYLDGPKVHLSVMYMIPIYFCTWFVGFKSGALLSLVASLSLLIDPIFYPDPNLTLGITFLNMGSLMLVNTTFSFVLAFLKKSMSRLKDQNQRDALTGLLNAGAFFDLAERERLLSLRYGRPLTLCFLDLDNFKQINDSFGHMAGSELLKMTGTILRDGIRETDQAARLGGDEFILLFPETNLHEAQPIITRIKNELGEAFRERGFITTPSMGLAAFQKIPASVNDLVHQADLLMYRSKKAGKNRITAETIGAGTKL